MALIFVAIIVGAFILGSQLPGVSVLCIDLMPIPIQSQVKPMQWSIPPDPYNIYADVNAEVKLVRHRGAWQKEVEIINGTTDPFKLHGIDLILTLILEVYSSNGSLILRRALTLDGGMERTIKIYRTDFEDLQPLRVVLEINIKLLYGGSTIFEKTFTIERDGITIQT